MPRIVLILAILPAALACDDESASPPDGDAGAIVGNQIRLETGNYVVAAGAEEYRCWWFDAAVPPDRAVREIRNFGGPAVHHVALFWAPEAPREPHACEDFGFNWVLVAGAGTSDEVVELAEGTALPVRPGGSYVLQVHFLNATEANVTTSTAYELTLTEPGQTYSPLGLYVIANIRFTVPERSTDYVVESRCRGDLPESVEFVHLFPHMHGLGTRFEAEHIGARGSTMMYDEAWLFDEQDVVPMEPAVTSLPADEIRIRCHYDNPTDQPVSFGLQTSDEMCVGVLFYHPADRPEVRCVPD